MITMARDNWSIDAPAAWAMIQQQGVLGLLKAYRGRDPASKTNLALLPLSVAEGSYDLVVEPTEATCQKLDKIAVSAKIRS